MVPIPTTVPRRRARAAAAAAAVLVLACGGRAAQTGGGDPIGEGLPLPAAGASAPLPVTGPLAPRLIEGDILVGPALATRGIGLGASEMRWPRGELPYLIDRSLDARSARAVQAAIAHWNAVAGISLVAVEPGATPPRDHIVFQKGPGCASWVGRQGGAQEIWVASGCSVGSVMHEIGHALGLEHEHTRHDRDAHIVVHWERIDPDKRHNFDRAPPDARLLGPYDLDSIMHYGADNFSRDGRPTIEPIDPAAGRRMGQREAPSAGDIAGIARLYASDLALVLDADDSEAAREIALHVTAEHAQGAHGIELSLVAEGLEVLTQSIGPWRCASAGTRVDCSLARLDGGASETLVLTLAEPLAVDAIDATLVSKTPDLDPVDNRVAAREGASFTGVPGAGRSLATAAPAVGPAALATTSPFASAAPPGSRLAFGDASDASASGGAGSLSAALLAALAAPLLGRVRRRSR